MSHQGSEEEYDSPCDGLTEDEAIEVVKAFRDRKERTATVRGRMRESIQRIKREVRDVRADLGNFLNTALDNVFKKLSGD